MNAVRRDLQTNTELCDQGMSDRYGEGTRTDEESIVVKRQLHPGSRMSTAYIPVA